MTTKTETVANETSTEVQKRKITVFSTQAKSSQVIESSASTWGELKAEMTDVGNVRAVLRETRNSLDTPSSKLPDQDFTLFLYPQRVKSGNEENVTLEKKKRTVKVRKLQEAPWDTAVDQEVEEALGNYQKEFKELLDSVVLKEDLMPSKEEISAENLLEQEAAVLAAELGIE